MKRSRMIGILHTAISDNPGLNSDRRDLHEDALIAILSALESAGMAPPFDSDVYLRQRDQWGPGQANGREWSKE